MAVDTSNDTQGLVSPLRVSAAIIVALLTALLWRLYNDTFGNIPGPLIVRFTPDLAMVAHLDRKIWSSCESRPNEVDVSDGAALNLIYVKNGGYLKSPVYRSYDVKGFETIFSALDPAHRAPKAKAVAPMLPTNVLDDVMAEMKRRKAETNGAPVDVLNLSRALALDPMTAYLFREYFNGIDKGRIFCLPGWLYDFVDEWAAKLDKKKIVVAQSIDMIQEYATRVADKSIVEEKDNEPDTFQGRLLAAGISRDEAIAHVVGVMFAGTGAAGTTMSILCWNLAQHPENLRLAMANPTRFRHIVPPGGMQLPGLPNIPAGTSVGAGAFMLHHNPEAFPNPREFMPERWLSPSQEMLRDSFYFGARSRQCIARNLASAGDVLRGAMAVQDKTEIVEWSNAKIVDEKIEVHW
ncbi:cytochrome P450 [Fusarium oxysporum]|nr:cytochrome P450 [Fusarium oxysporum]